MLWFRKGPNVQASNTTLQKRVSALERQLREVRSELQELRKAAHRPWWERLAGTFKNDPLFDEVVKAGQAYRRSLAARARS
jgi:hypothetical protein